MGSYLRTNYRLTGKELDINAIGGGVVQGAWGGGAGTRREYGGFIVGSAGLTGVSVFKNSGVGAMSNYYGEGMFGAGYKIMPLVFHVKSIATSYADIAFFPTMSWHDNSVFAAVPRVEYMDYSGASIASIAYSVTDSTLPAADLIWAGLIVSGP